MKYEPIPLTEDEIKKNQAIVEKVLEQVLGDEPEILSSNSSVFIAKFNKDVK